MIELKCNGSDVRIKMKGNSKHILSEICMIYCKLCEQFAEEIGEPVESIMLHTYQSSAIATKEVKEIKEVLEKLVNNLSEGDD